MKFNDRIEITDNNLKPYKEYKNVTIARTGTQKYLESEILKNGSPAKVVEVERNTSDVRESVYDMAGIPITENHPNEFLDYKENTSRVIGVIKEAWFKDGKVKANLLFFSSPKYKEFSLGYTSKIIKANDRYKQTDIKVNHLANLANSRCGKICSLQDEQINKRTKMTSLVINDKAYEVEDSVKAYIDVLESNVKNIEDVAQKAFNDGKDQALKDIELKKTAEEFNVLIEDADGSIEVKRKIVDTFGLDTTDKTEEYLDAVIDTQRVLTSTPESVSKEIKDNGFDYSKYTLGAK